VAFALTPRLQCADTFAVVAAMLADDPADANPTSPMAAYRHALGDIAAGGWSRVDGVPEDLIPYNSVAAGNRVLLLDEGDGLVIGQDGPAVALDLPRVPYQPGVRPVWTGEALLVVDFRTGEVTSVDLPA
jgi:hypothetical protein